MDSYVILSIKYAINWSNFQISSRLSLFQRITS